jgi:hypothetical protein
MTTKKLEGIPCIAVKENQASNAITVQAECGFLLQIKKTSTFDGHSFWLFEEADSKLGRYPIAALALRYQIHRALNDFGGEQLELAKNSNQDSQ